MLSFVLCARDGEMWYNCFHIKFGCFNQDYAARCFFQLHLSSFLHVNFHGKFEKSWNFATPVTTQLLHQLCPPSLFTCTYHYHFCAILTLASLILYYFNWIYVQPGGSCATTIVYRPYLTCWRVFYHLHFYFFP